LNPRGSIGVLSSVSGIVGVPFRTAYCASKFAVQGFFEALRNELHNEVNISFFSPGWVDTGIQDRHLIENQKHDHGKRMSVEDCIEKIAHGMSFEFMILIHF
jgi:dehydrogenase/reductase SDR family member 7B